MLVTRSGNFLAPPEWALDFGGREHIELFPAKLDASKFLDDAGARVTLTGNASVGTNEQQTATVTGGPTGGTFTLSFAGQTTAGIAFNATADVVEHALEALSTIGVGNVVVTGSAGGPYTVTFINGLGNRDVAAMTASGASLTGGTSPAVAIATTVPGVAGATTLAVTAMTQPIPAGSTLRFGQGLYAYTTVDVAIGDTSITVEPLSAALATGAVAVFSKFRRKYIRSGELVGRTLAERNSNLPFHPPALDGSDDEIYFTYNDIVDAQLNGDCELYRHGSQVAQNYLPQVAQDLLSNNAALLAKVRTLYTLVNAQD